MAKYRCPKCGGVDYDHLGFWIWNGKLECWDCRKVWDPEEETSYKFGDHRGQVRMEKINMSRYFNSDGTPRIF